MGNAYSNKEREEKRLIFAINYKQDKSIVQCCRAANISPSTYYNWNKDGNWNKKGGWSKDKNISKDNTWSK